MKPAPAKPRPASPGALSAVAPPRAATPAPSPLWLCLSLPCLPLEVRSGGGDEDARVIVDRAGRVVQASPAAAENGVAPGMPLNAALALCPGLAPLARDEDAEAAALARLAAWGGAFTSMVSLVSPAALLLEVRGSLRLFGGLAALRQRVLAALHATGHAGRDAVAPTPLAALWLARAGEVEAVTERAGLAGRIGRLRPGVTGWPEQTLRLLQGMGVETLADCLRLPRDGFARRVGREPLADLDRALGRLADPRPAFQPPPRYRGALELAAETSDTGRLEHALRSLFAELEGFLRARQRAVSRLRVGFSHLRHPPSELRLGLASPGLRAAHFAELFSERLERFALPAPVISVTLEAEPGEAFDPGALGLFGDEPGDAAALRLVERLRARLGRQAVHGLGLLDEHRPEQAWRVAEPGEASWSAPPAGTVRPAWLLATPRPLRNRDGRPVCDGVLQLESGPERLETGWWDGREIARDYWIARTPTGARLWIFRERHCAGPARWFLHGIFG